MKPIFSRVLLGATLVFATSWAHAAITCTSITSTGFSTSFSGTVPPNNITPASFTVTCNRNLAGDPTTLSYSVGANNGLNPSGSNNQAALGTNRLQYDAYKTSACSGKWKVGGSNEITDSMTLSGFTATSKQTNYWGCIVLSQTLATGTYTDTVTMTLSYPGGSNLTNTFPVNISAPSVCTITTAPGTLSFTYTAFGAAQTASTSFQPNCTIYLAYSMALSATSDVVSGLNYSLALNTINSGGSSPLASTGTGAAQTFYINGNMAAGQAGTCATGTCSATNTHTLTITY